MKIRDYIKPFRLAIAFVIILSFGQVMADLMLPNYMADIVDDGIAKGNTGFILRTGGVMILVALVGICCATTAGYFASRTALGLARNLRKSIFAHITRFSLSEFDQVGTSSLITRTTNDVEQIRQTTFMMLRMMLRAPLMCIGGAIMAMRKDADLSLLLLGILPVVGIMIYVILVKAVPLFRQVQKKIDQLNLVVRETLVGIRIIRAFSRIGFEKKRFSVANEDLTNTSIKVNRLMAILNPTMNFCMNLLVIVIVYMASFRIDKGNLMVGDMMAFIQYAMQIFMSMTMITMLFVMLPRAMASAERIREVFDLKADVNDPKQSEATNRQLSGSIRFNHVSFRFRHAENCAVCDVSFTASPGETVAIIGGTGSGKTSLINLIPRYYDVESGSIEIDGIDIRKMKQEELRDLIGIVPQKITVFSGTVCENIRMGKQNAEYNEVVHAAKVAQADEFIQELPKKYDTEIAQGGTNLSGGQKQRLSIARAVVRQPKIYLFDDSFSALDFKTDAKVRAALNKETDKSTVIVVAQRITSIKDADRILVMDAGKIVGEGTHEQLLKTNKVYREIAESQLSPQEL